MCQLVNKGFCCVGHQTDRSTINYEVPGSLTTRIMGVFLALGSIAFAFGDTILPEIQVGFAKIYKQYKGKHTQKLLSPFSFVGLFSSLDVLMIVLLTPSPHAVQHTTTLSLYILITAS